MSLNSGSSRISATRPKIVTCRYQSCPSSTVTETRGSRRMCFRRARVASMLTSSRSPSQSYQVAAACGDPSRRRVAITAGFALRSSASTSGGSGGFGTLFSFLAPVALEPQVRLFDRCRAQIRVRTFALARLEIGARRGDELVLGHPVVHALCPNREVAARSLDVLRNLLDAGDDAEVGQGQTLRLVTQNVIEGALPRFEVDVGRRRLREHVLSRNDANAGRVAGEERSVLEQVADVVGRMTGRGKRFQAGGCVPDDLDVLLGHGERLAVERIEAVAVQAAGRADQPGRIDHVRCADLRDVHADVGLGANDVAGGAGMVEMDVREQQVVDLAQVDCFLQALEAGRGTAVEERRALRCV